MAEIKIRLLSSELKGRELLLPEGEFSFGERDCDVLLSLPQGKQLILLNQAQAGLFIQSAETVWAAGKVFAPDQPLPFGVVIETMSIAFIIGDANATLTDIPIPSRQHKMRTKWLLFSSLFIIALLLFFIFILRFLPHNPSLTTTDLQQRVIDKLAQLNLTKIKVIWINYHTVQLVGHCKNSARMESLHHFLTSQNVVFIDETICNDQLIQNVNEILSQYGYEEVLVTSGEQLGTVTIQGRFNAGAQWNKIESALNEVVGLQDWKIVNNHQALLTALISKLEQHNLLLGLNIILTPRQLKINGALSNEQQQQLTKLLQIMQQSEPHFPSFVIYPILSQQDLSQILPASIITYAGNSTYAFVELANGTRLSVSSILPNGYKVIAIGMLGLQLLKENRIVFIPFSF